MRRENRNKLLCMSLAIVLALATSTTVYAISISGDVLKRDFSGFNDAKVTAERAQDYSWGRTGSLGSYSLGVSTTNWYRVDSMAEGYDHDSQTQIKGGTSGVRYILDTRPMESIQIIIAADEEYRNAHGSDWIDDATAKLRLAEPWFSEEHSIQFEVVGVWPWITEPAVGATCASYTTDLAQDFGWPDPSFPNDDLLWGITGEPDLVVDGCTSNVNAPGQHPVTIIRNQSPDQDVLVMHEMTHVYNYDHQCVTPKWYDIMQSKIDDNFNCTLADPAYQIKNWKPVGDDRMEQNRDWYTPS